MLSNKSKRWHFVFHEKSFSAFDLFLLWSVTFVSLLTVVVIIKSDNQSLWPFFSVTFKETHLEIPMPILALKKFGPDISWKYKVMAKAADFLLMRRTLFEHLEYRGVRTYLWVLNEPEDFDRGTYDLFT